MAPQQSLPPETLGEIFERVVARGLSRGGMNEKETKEVLKLTLVCKRWRDVAHCTKVLWSSAFVDTPTVPLNHTKLNVWFGRAGAFRKTLCTGEITTEDQCSEDSLVEAECRFHHLTEYLKAATPLYHLHINVKGWGAVSCFERMARDLESSAPPSWLSLQHLSWYVLGYGPISTPVAFPPSLSALDLGVSAHSHDLSHFIAAIAPVSLTSLRLSMDCYLHLDSIASILRRCTTLQHLGLHRGRHTPSGNQCVSTLPQVTNIGEGHMPIILPALLSIELRVPGLDSVYAFLNLLQVPNLDSIRIRADKKVHHLLKIMRSLNLLTPGPYRPSPQHITIYRPAVRPGVTVPAGELSEILSNLPPSVRHLRIEKIPFDAGGLLAIQSASVEAPTSGALSTPVLPGLRTFEVVGLGHEFTLGAFLEYMKKGRARPPSPAGEPSGAGNVALRFHGQRPKGLPKVGSLEGYRNEVTLQELKTSFGIVMDLIVRA